MSDDIQPTVGDSTNVAPAPAPKVTKKEGTPRKASQVAMSAVIALYAKKHGIDTTRAGKAIRSKIRAMGDAEVSKAWPEFKKSGKRLRDGNRYPTMMPRALAEKLLGVTRKK